MQTYDCGWTTYSTHRHPITGKTMFVQKRSGATRVVAYEGSPDPLLEPAQMGP